MILQVDDLDDDSGHDELPTQTSCTMKSEIPLKMTTGLHGLIPKKKGNLMTPRKLQSNVRFPVL